MKRIVVTGPCVVSCIGAEAEQATESLRAGRSGISDNLEHTELGFRSQISRQSQIDTFEYIARKGQLVTLTFAVPVHLPVIPLN